MRLGTLSYSSTERHYVAFHNTRQRDGEKENTMEVQEASTLKAYKRSPALTNSTWYKGMLHSQMAGTADNNGAFDFVIRPLPVSTTARVVYRPAGISVWLLLW